MFPIRIQNLRLAATVSSLYIHKYPVLPLNMIKIEGQCEVHVVLNPTLDHTN